MLSLFKYALIIDAGQRKSQCGTNACQDVVIFPVLKIHVELADQIQLDFLHFHYFVILLQLKFGIETGAACLRSTHLQKFLLLLMEVGSDFGQNLATFIF
jgi:hypothetical protein